MIGGLAIYRNLCGYICTFRLCGRDGVILGHPPGDMCFDTHMSLLSHTCMRLFTWTPHLHVAINLNPTPACGYLLEPHTCMWLFTWTPHLHVAINLNPTPACGYLLEPHTCMRLFTWTPHLHVAINLNPTPACGY